MTRDWFDVIAGVLALGVFLAVFTWVYVVAGPFRPPEVEARPVGVLDGHVTWLGDLPAHQWGVTRFSDPQTGVICYFVNQGDGASGLWCMTAPVVCPDPEP